MCSQNRVALSPTAQSRITEQFNFSDEETDEEESGDSVKLFRCRSAPAADAIRDQGKTTMLEKSKTERAVKRGGGFSLEDRMKEWHRSSVVDRKAESAAKKYQEMVSNDTLKHLRNSVLVAGSIAGKGADINEELRRQERVLRKADTDISHAEYETDQTTETLKGMKSLRSKLTSSIRKKKPKLKVQTFNDFDLLDGEIGLCSMSSMFTRKKISVHGGSSKDPTQKEIKAGMEDLNAALDIIKVQQMDTAWTLNRQEKHLAVFENKLNSTHTKINQQSQVISSIINK